MRMHEMSSKILLFLSSEPGFSRFFCYSRSISRGGTVYEVFMDFRVFIIASLEIAAALWLLRRLGLLEGKKDILISAFFIVGAMALRLLVLDCQTLDYQTFLSRWVEYFRVNGGFAALKNSIGNYNVPYLYFLALFSYSGISDLYLIKLLSILFDVILAYAAARLVGIVKGGRTRQLLCFFMVLFLPTVYFNGALWGQCDSIYVAFAVLAVCLALDDRPICAMVCMAVSFGFKLQAVFVMPVFVVLWLQGRFKLWHFFVFPAAYVLLVLPAVIAGRPFVDTLTLYLNQAETVGSALNYNSSSVYSFFYNVADPEKAAKLGIIAAFAFMVPVLAGGLISRKRPSPAVTLGAAVLLAVGIPFLLPHMHDRYFFAADILTLVLAFVDPFYAPAAILTQFASLLGYHAYLEMRFLLPMRYGALGLIVTLAFAAAYYASSLSELKRSGK